MPSVLTEGFGSRATTLKDSRAKDKSITMDSVNELFRNNVEEKRRQPGENRLIPSSPNWEYQLYFFVSKDDIDNFQEYSIGPVSIDIFTKYCVVKPNKSKQPPDVLAGLMEGSLNSEVITSHLKEQTIEIHRTRGHPAFAESFIRTFKSMLFKRFEHDEDEKGTSNIQWTDYIPEIMLTYNEKNAHSALNMTPKEARQPKNENKAKLNMSMRARKSRTYPEVDINDEVEVMRKKEITEK